MTWGPFRLKGGLGILNNVVALTYLTIILLFGFWPPNLQTDAATMNYSALVLGAVVIGSMVYYVGWMRRFYQGPIIEVEVPAAQ